LSQTTRGAREPLNVDKLVEAAARLFRQRGYAATTTRQLSSDLGIQRASLYHHISTKEDLLFEISIRSLTHITDAVGAAVETAPADQRLLALIRAHLATALADQDMHATMLIELNHLSPERRAAVVTKRAAYEQLVAHEISQAQAVRLIRDDLSARQLTLALLNLLNWTIFWYKPDGADTPASLAGWMSDLFLDGATLRQQPATEARRH
jgi:AcrR family transcriptional regulator